MTGDGKTHYIETQLSQYTHRLRITINESFIPLTLMQKLCVLPVDVPNCAVHINVSLLPPGVSIVGSKV